MNQTSPRCSVIMPNHNCLSYLKQAVASVQAQDMSEWELIIVDDCSTDGSREWIAQQTQVDPRIRMLPVRVRHPAAARNTGVQIAQAKWLAFLDADDTWTPDKLSRQLNYHQQHPNVVLSFTDYRHVDESNTDLGTCYEFWQLLQLQAAQPGFHKLADPLAFLFACNCIGTSTVMASADAIWQVGGFDMSLPSAEDWDLWLKLANLGEVAFSNQCDMTYLMRSGSESSKLDCRVSALQQIYARHEQHLAPHHVTARRNALAHIENAKADAQRTAKHFSAAMAAKIRSLMLHPNKRQVRELVAFLKPM